MKKIIQRLSKDIKKRLGENLISLYVVGTAATSEKNIEDIDFFVIVKKVDFDEDKLNKLLTKKYSFPIKLRAILYDELLGKVKKATKIMKFGIFTSPILIRILNSSKFILGKKIDFKKLPIKSINPNEYLKFELKRMIMFLDIEKKRKKLPFSRKDFPKFIAYLVRAELFLKKKKFFLNYKEMAHQFKDKPNHIIHDCIAIKYGRKRLTKIFFKKVELYIKEMEKQLR